MSEIQVGNPDDIRVSGFDLSVTLPNGTVKVIPGGVTELLKGDLTIVSEGGGAVSRTDILSKVNLQGQAAVLVPELLTSGKPAEGDKETITKLTKEAEASREALKDMREQVEELKKIKEEMEKKEKEQEEKEEEVESESEMVEELIQQLNQTMAALASEGAEAMEAAKSPEKMSEEPTAPASEDKRSNATPNANIGMGTSNASAAPSPTLEGTEPEEESNLFVDLALSSRSDSGGKGDFITNVVKPTFEATTLPGATITVTLNGVDYQVTADSGGKAVIIIEEALEDGEYSIKVKAVDENGGTVSISETLIIDTVAPEGTFVLGTDTGSSDTDNITNNNTPTFTGRISGDPASVTLSVGDQSYNLTAKNGEYSFTLPVELPDGDYEFTLTILDEAGNETVLKQSVTIDTVNEFAVTLSDLTDSGVADDWITNAELPVFRLEYEPGTIIDVVVNGEAYPIDTSGGSPTMFQPPDPLAEGNHKIEFIATDVAGNRVEIEKTLVIDTTPPAFEYLGLSADSDTGTAGDNLTNITTPTFHGRGEQGATIHLEIDGVVYNTIVGDNGRWSLSLEHPLPEDTYAVTAFAEDTAGNRSEVATSSVTIDTTGADITGGLDATSDSGLSTSDGITNTKDLMFSGKTEPNIKVTLNIVDLGITEIVTSDGEGNYSFTTTKPSPVPEGTYEFVISAVDAAGNLSEKPATGTVVVDRQVTDFTASLTAESDTGVDDSDNLTSVTRPTLSGTGEPGAVVSIVISNAAGAVGNPHGPITVDSRGQWQYTLPEPLADDSYNFNFTITDLAGNTASIPLPIIIDTTIVLTAAMDGEAESGLTNQDTPNFTGTCDPGVTVTLVLSHELSRNTITLEAKTGSDGSWSITVPEKDALNAQGNWSWSVQAEDAAGNRAEDVTGGFVLDTIPPEVELSLVSPNTADGTLTNDPDLDLSIRSEPGAQVSITVFRVEEGIPGATPAYATSTPLTVPANGQLFCSTTELTDGDYIYHVTVADVAGNITEVPEKSITIDTVPPALGEVILTAASDSSTVRDNITSVTELSFQGTGSEVGSTIEVTARNKITGEVITLDPASFEVTDSNWVYKVPTELADGEYTFAFTAQDLAGNRSAVESIGVQVDTTPPELGAVTLQSGSDTGSSDSDFVTNNTNPVFSGSSAKGDTITIAIYRGDVLVKTGSTVVTNEDGTWNVQVQALTDGDYHWVVTTRDVAGNQSRLDSPEQTLTIDTVYTGATGKLDDDSNSGSITDNITRFQEVVVSGTGEPGSRVTLKSLTAPDGTTLDVSSVTAGTATASGQWQLNLPFLGAGDGNYTWVVTLTDIAGNAKDVEGIVQLDTTTVVTGELESDSGISDADNITSDSSPTFIGTGEVGSTVRLIITAPNKQLVNSIPTAVVAKDGTWRITAPELSEDGEYKWKAEITDVAGNVETTPDMTFVVDITLPAILNVQLDSPVGFTSDIPNIQDTTPDFSGRSSEANCSVKLHVYRVTDGVVSGSPYYSSKTVTANIDGEFSITVTTPLPDGEYRWGLEVSDLAGNRAFSEQQAMIIDTSPPAVTDVRLTTDSDTGLEGNDGVTNESKPVFTGRCEPGTRISIELLDADGAAVALKPDYVVTGNSGAWSYTPESVLPDGTYTWVASAMDPAGNIGTSSTVSLVIDTEPPSLTGVQLDAASDTGELHNDGITNDKTPTFSGTCEKDALIVLQLFDSKNPGTAAYTLETRVTAENGSWSITPTSPIADGTYHWQVTATDLAGNETLMVNPQNLVVDTTITGFTAAMEASSDTGTLDSDKITKAGQVSIAGKAEPGSKIVLTSLVNTDTEDVVALTGVAVTADANGSWSLTTPALGADGLYDWTVEVTDIAGNTATISNSFTLDRTIAVTGALSAESDSGALDTDNNTNIKTPTIAGTGLDGDKISVKITGPGGFAKTLETTVVNGEWQVTFDGDNALTVDGGYRWTVTATDIAGNTDTDDGSFTLDTVAPTATVALTNDTGLVSDDNITGADALTIKTQLSGNAHSVQLVVWRESGSADSPAFTQTVTLASGATEYTFTTSALADGDYCYKAIVKDLAGNTSESPVREVTVDTTPPELSAVTQEGVSNGTYIGDTDIQFSGTAEPGARVYLVLTKGSETITSSPPYVEANTLGNWEYALQPSVANTLTDGTYQWSFLAVDVAGNISPAQSGEFTLDTVIPVVTFTGLSGDTDTGDTHDDLLTNAERPVFCGTVNESAFVTVTLNSIPPGTNYSFTTATGVNGSWELAATENLKEGTYKISVTATDMAGNLSEAVEHSVNMEIDRTITGGDAGDFGLTTDTDSGTSSSDDITNSTAPRLTGTVEAGTVVTLKLLTAPGGTTVTGFTPISTTATDGNWTLSLPTIGPAEGTYNYQLEYSDAAGNSKIVTGSFLFDSSINLTAQFDSTTGTDDDGAKYSNNATPTLVGTGDAGDKITVVINGPGNNGPGDTQKTLNTTVDAHGQWTVTTSALTQDGTYTWSATASDIAGNTKEITGSFILDTTAPVVTVALENDTGINTEDGITNQSALKISVQADDAKSVQLKVWQVGTPDTFIVNQNATLNSSGAASFTTKALTDGEYEYRVIVTDIAGNVTETAAERVTIDTVLPVIGESVTIANLHNDEYVNSQGVSFSGTGEVGSRIYLTLTDKNGQTVTGLNPASVVVNNQGKWTYTLASNLSDGNYGWSFVAEDLAGNRSSTVSGTVTMDTTDPLVNYLGIGSSDSGLSNSDNITNDQTPLFTGTVNELAKITVTLVSGDGLTTYQFESDGYVTGTWSITASQAITDGIYTVQVTATDKAGNAGPVDTGNLTIDTVVSGGDAGSFGLTDDSDSGVADDNITNKEVISLTGTVEAGTRITLTQLNGPDGAVSLGTPLPHASSDQDGAWTIALPNNLPEGNFGYTLRYVDVAGNTKDVNGSLTVDRTINVSAQFNSQTGIDGETIYSNDNTPSIGGNGTQGDKVTVTLTSPSGTALAPLLATVGSSGTWSVTTPELAVDGVYQWSMTAIDAAGNTQAAITGSFTLDTEPPTLSAAGLVTGSDTGFATDDNITSDKTPEFSISGEAGSRVVIKLWSGNQASGTPAWTSTSMEIPSAGSITVSLPQASALGDGHYTWTATLTDVAGNTTVSDAQPLQVDTTPPTMPTLDLASDTGTDTTDNLTNDNTPLFQGSGEVGTRISLIITSASGVTQPVQPAYVVVGNTGQWSYQMTNALPDGTYTVVSQSMDAAGNTTLSDSLMIAIDTHAPALQNVRMASASDSADTSDGITNVKSPVFEGRSEQDAAITMVITKDGVTQHTLTTTAGSGGNWSINNVPELGDGDYRWQVTAKDAAGNISPPQNGVFTIDTAVSEFTVKLATASDSGDSTSDAITNRKAVQLSGDGENGASVSLVALSRNGEAINVATVNAVTVANGVWTLTLPTLGLGDGDYNYTVKIVDVAGNEETLNNKITLDTTLPILTASVDGASDSGSSSTDGITNDKTPVISGTVSEPCKVTLFLKQGASTVATYGPVEASDSWSINVAAPLADGTYTWYVQAEDVAGNIRSSDSETLVIDTKGPVLNFALASDMDTGHSATDTITNKQQLTFSGTASGERSSAVKLELRFGPSGGQSTTHNATANGGEQFEFTVQAPNDGLYTWSLTATDVAGNTTTKNGSVNVDTTLNDFSSNTGLSNESDTGDADDNLSNDTTPTFTGATEPSSRVVLTMTMAGTQVVETQTTANNRSGEFTITVPSNQQLTTDGDYQWQLKAIDVAGNEKTKEGTYRLDTVAPEITFTLSDDTGRSSSDWITKDKTVRVTGSTDDSANVVVTLLKGSTQVNKQSLRPSGGSWTYSYDTELEDGTYTFKVESTDAAGNKYSSQKALVIDTQVTNTIKLASDTGSSTSDQITNAENLQFTGTTDKDATVTLIVKNSAGATIHTYEPLVNNSTGQWSFELPTVLAEGTYNFQVTAKDVAGNTNTSEDYRVEIDRTAPVLGGIQMDSTDDTGVKGDWTTENQQVSISGVVSPAASTVTIIISGVAQVITATVGADGSFTAQLPELEYGEYQLAIRATDVAGNMDEQKQTLTISPDIVPFVAWLAVESDSGEIGDNVTNQTTPMLSGDATPGYKIEATIDGQTVIAVADVSGSWSLTLPGPLDEGSHTVSFVIKDSAGNVQEPVDNYTFTVDTSVATTVQLDASSDSGTLGDFITNSNNVYITGVSEPGVTLEIRNKSDNTLVSELVTTGNNWGYLLTGLNNGKHTFVINMTDKAGNTATKEFAVTIDRTAPTLTMVVNGDSDVGSMVSNQIQQTFSGNVSGATKLVLTVNGSHYNIVANANGSWSHTLTLRDGINNFSIVASDVAGNESTIQGMVNIKTQINFQMSLANDNGRFPGDKVLSGDKLSFSGRGGAGDNVELILTNADGTQVGRGAITVPSSGEWTYEFTGLDDGEYKVTANVSDDAGNTLTRTVKDIVVDNTNVGFTASLTDIDGVADDNIVKEGRPTFAGNGEVGSEVTLTIDGKVYNAEVSSSGTWQFQLPTALADGQHTITIFSTDLAGNESATKTINFTTDTEIPELTYALRGVVDNDGVQYINASQSTVVFNGTVSEAGRITIEINNQTFTKDMTAGGDWSIDVGTIVEREHAYTVTFVDKAGNQVTDAGTVIVDRTINTYITLVDSSDTVIPGALQYLDCITKSTTLVIGFNRGGNRTDRDLTASVEVTGPEGFTPVTYTNISTASNWQLPQTLAINGVYNFKWNFSDAAGNTSTRSMNVTLDTEIDPIDIGDLSYDGEAMVAGQTLTVSDRLISLSFNPPAGNEYRKVQITVNGASYDARAAGSNWEFVGVPLLLGENVMTIKAWDVAGNETSTTQSVMVKTGFTTLDLSINGSNVTDLQNIEDVYSNDPTRVVALNGQIDSGSQVAILVDGVAVVPSPTVNAEGNWSYSLTLEEGNNKVVIRFTDVAGNVELVNFNAVIDTIVPILTVDEITGEGYQVIGGDAYIRGSSINLSGRVDAGTTIQSVTVNGAAIALSALVASGGAWSLEIAGLQEGDNTIIINSQDKAGNTNTETLTVNRDTQISDFTVAVNDEDGGVPDFSGTVETGASVNVTITDAATGKETVIAATVNKDGTWSAPTNDSNFISGNYSWVVEATDVAGNTKQQEGQFTLDTSVANFTSTLVDANNDGLINEAPSFTGTVEPGSTVVVTLTPAAAGGEAITLKATVTADGNWSATAATLPDGSYSWSVTATDAAGNTASSTPANFTLDTAVTFTGNLMDASADGTINEAPSFAGTVEPGSTVTVTLTPAAADGEAITLTAVVTGSNWTATAASLPDGNYSWHMTATDAAGNSDSTTPANFTLDTTGPNLTGSLVDASADGMVNEAPSFTGSVEPGSTVTVTLTPAAAGGEAITLKATVTADGTWSATATDLPDGNYSWQVSATDAVGNIASNTAANFTLDSTVTNFTSTLVDANSDGLIKEAPSFTGTVEPGSTVTVTLTPAAAGGEAITLKATVTADGTWSATATDLPDGNYSWQVSATDAVGNIASSTAANFTLDSTVTNFTSTLVDANSDGLIKEAPSFTGTVEPGSTVTVTLTPAAANGEAISLKATVTAAGAWSATAADLPDGAYSWQVTATDTAGNSTSSTAASFTLDTTAPTLTGSLVDANADGTVNETPSFAGTVEPGSTVTVMITGTGDQIIPVNATVDAQGNWTASTTDLPDGNYSWSVAATDAAGNSKDIVGTGFTLDSAVTGFTSTLADVGADDTVTEAPSFTGTVEPGSTVTVTLTPATADGEAITLNAVVTEAGAWSATAADLPDGNYSWNVTATDAAGNSLTSKTASFTLNSGVQAASFTLDEHLIADLVGANADGIVANAPSFTGTVEPGSTVTVMITGAGDQIITLDAAVDASGNWTANAINLPQPLPDGDYSWSVTAIDAEGNSTETMGTSFALDSSLADLSGALMDTSTNGEITDVPVFTGATEPGSDVLVELIHQDTGEQLTLSTISDMDGHWSITADHLADGNYSWNMSATDTAGNNSSAPGGEFSFSATNIAPPSPTLSLVSDTPDEPLLETRVFTGESAADSTVTLSIAGKVYETAADDDGDWMIKAEFDQSGIFNYQLQYQAVDGESITEQGITNVRMVDFDSLDSPHNDQASGSSAGSDSSARHVAAAEIAPPSVDQFHIEHDQESF